MCWKETIMRYWFQHMTPQHEIHKTYLSLATENFKKQMKITRHLSGLTLLKRNKHKHLPYHTNPYCWLSQKSSNQT